MMEAQFLCQIVSKCEAKINLKPKTKGFHIYNKNVFKQFIDQIGNWITYQVQ